MKTFYLLPLLWVVTVSSRAQQGNYDGQALGWIKIYNYTTPTKPIKVDHRTYTIGQQSICNLFANWIQASYLPTGGLGDVRKMASEKLGLYNQVTKSLPQSYGAYSKTYVSLRKSSSGKLEPADNTSHNWRIIANQTIGHQVELLSTPDQYYFYIQHYKEGAKDDYKEYEEVSKLGGFDKHPALNKYIHFYQPKNGFLGTGLQYVVILCNNNTLPFIPVTIGEFIEKTEKRIPEWYSEELAKNKESNSYDPKRVVQEKKWIDEKLERAKINLAKLKEKYKNKWGDPALVMPGNINMQDLTSSIQSTDWDFFEDRGLERFPVYKHDPVIAARCKTDQPQWIVISWDAEGVLNEEPAGIHLHESILNNFNFDYVYNYFFQPEKIKGINYKPLRSPGKEE